jgi:hypothetical protein
MQNLAQVAAEHKRALWKAAVAHADQQFRTPRRWKVNLCVQILSEIEVEGDILSVDRLAEKLVDQAHVYLHTAPAAFRKFVERRTDPKNPESPLEWVEVVFAPVDPLDGASPWAWQLKR